MCVFFFLSFFFFFFFLAVFGSLVPLDEASSQTDQIKLRFLISLSVWQDLKLAILSVWQVLKPNALPAVSPVWLCV